VPTLDDALKFFIFPITGGGKARLDERDRQNLMQHLAQYGFVITHVNVINDGTEFNISDEGMIEMIRSAAKSKTTHSV
jgi:hypothetical protein